MVIVRRTLKAYMLSICVFLTMTMILGALIRFTAYHEDWSAIGLTVALSISTLLLGIIEGNIVGKKGLLIGSLSAVLFVFIILFAVSSLFSVGAITESLDVMDMIPVLSGAAGGVMGTNSNK